MPLKGETVLTVEYNDDGTMDIITVDENGQKWRYTNCRTIPGENTTCTD